MHRLLLHIGSILIAVAAVMLAAMIVVSCSRDLAVIKEQPETDYCNVGLRLTLDEIPDTKAPSGDYDDGRSTPYENYINVAGGDFRLLLFESAEPYGLAAEVTGIEIKAIEADAYTSKTYVLLGQVPAGMNDGSYKVVFLANWNGCGVAYPAVTPGETTIDDVAERSRYECPSDFRLGTGRGIPMFGIKDCEGLTFRQDSFTDFGRLHLLRAMAKIQVKAADSGTPIVGAFMTRSNDSGLAAPFGIYTQGDYVRNSYVNDYLDDIHLPDPLAVTSDVPFTEQEDGSFVLYVPEYDNTSASATPSRIHLKFDAGDGIDDEIIFEDDIDFKYYTVQAAADAGSKVGDMFDVKRNHYYKYTVSKNVDLSMKIVVDVIPYSEVTLEPDFGL